MRCPVHLCVGQEAVAVGVSAGLTKDDYALSGHRSHGHYLAKGGDLKAMIAELYGKETGCSKGAGGSMHLTDPESGFLGATSIVGGTIPIAVGVAFGSVMRGKNRVCVVYFGDGATEEGVFGESLNFAALKDLPVVFVCENNLFSVQSPLSVRQPEGREIFSLAQAQGIESYQGDGNNVLEVHEMAKRAVQKARRGDGSTFLEFKTYRWREHCGPNYDFDLGYRDEEEFKIWKERCPIKMLDQSLSEDSVVRDTDIKEMTQAIEDEIEAAFLFAKESPFPNETAMMDNIFACEPSEYE